MTSLQPNFIHDFQDIASGNLKIDNNLPISIKSTFADLVWDFSDENKLRNLSIGKSKQVINWNEFALVLPKTIIYEVKILALFFAICPRVISKNPRVINQGLKPNTYCPAIKKLLQFLVHLGQQSHNKNLFPQLNLELKENISSINSIFDITTLSLNNAAKSFYSDRQKDIRRLLLLFTNPIIQQYLVKKYPTAKSLNWNKNDLKNLSFKLEFFIESGTGKGYRDKPISDKLFHFLVKQATSDILSFLKRMKIDFSCIYNSKIEREIESSYIHCSFPELHSMYHKYMEIKTKDYLYMIKSNKRSNVSVLLRKQFKRRYKLSVNVFKDILERVKMAAQYLLLQFTGMRYSEAIQLVRGCIKQISNGDFVIEGTVNKNKSIELLTNLDYWVACPIVRDAVKVLELISILSNNEHLFAAHRMVVLNVKDRPLSNSSMNNAITSYIHLTDIDRKFSIEPNATKKRYQYVQEKHQLTTHRLRHTLSVHLYKANVGIPYISFHLKHVYEAHQRFQSINDVTLGYGGISKEIFANATAIKKVNNEIVNSLYHPEAPVAGPNAEEFKQRREDFFRGWLAAGVPLTEVIQDLADQGVPFVDVGLGFCGGKRKIEYADGTIEEPPCKGNLQCNPTKCNNAIITKMHIPIWRKVYEENKKKLNDPYMAYAKTEIQAIVLEAEQVLKELGINLN